MDLKVGILIRLKVIKLKKNRKKRMNDSEEKWRKTSTSAFIFVAKANLGCAHAEEN